MDPRQQKINAGVESDIAGLQKSSGEHGEDIKGLQESSDEHGEDIDVLRVMKARIEGGQRVVWLLGAATALAAAGAFLAARWFSAAH